MKIAVLTLCRDRLPYTQACFAALQANAGIPFDHLVLDNGSQDGTWEWLETEYKPLFTVRFEENIGIHAGMNHLLNVVRDDYDLLVKVDNDCELLTPGTLRAVAEHVLEKPEQPRIVSPLILGLRNRPGIYATKGRLGLTRAIGGIVMPLPPLFVKEGYRYDENAPVWGGDDEALSALAHERGGYTGYLLEYEANHYLSTEGQAADDPAYFARRVTEGGPSK